MPGLTRHPVLSMAESERTEGEKEIVVSLVRQLSWTHISVLLPLKRAVYSDNERGQYGYIHGEGVKVMPKISVPKDTKDFWQAVEDWRAQAGFDWPELTPDEVDGWRDRRPVPEFSWPD